MIHSQNKKFLVVKNFGTVATNSTDTSYFDTQGFHYAKVLVVCNPAGATNSSATFTTVNLREGDTTSSFATCSGFVTGTDFTKPTNNNTSYGAVIEFNVDLRKRKRYIQIQSTPGAAATDMGSYGVFAILSRAEEAPNTTAEALAAVITTSGAPTTLGGSARVTG